MRLLGKQIAFALPEGHFSMPAILGEIKKIVAAGADVFPLLLEAENNYSEEDEEITRKTVENLTGREIISTSLADEATENDPCDVEFDILVVAPCPGNLLGMLMNARRAAAPLNRTIRHLETGRPVVLALVPNGDSENLFKNVAQIINLKNFYLVPFSSSDSGGKQIFLSRLDLLYDTVLYALAHRQLQPVFLEPCWLPH